LTKYTRLSEKKFTVLVCPLDWGIGHATRCVPIISQLQQNNFNVIIAADGRPFDFLHDRFPDLEIIIFKGFRIRYSSGRNMILSMILQSPLIFLNIFLEHNKLKKIIREKKPDVVISDNRFGLWSRKVYSIYMTHQVMIKAPERWQWAEPLLHKLHSSFIRKYDECWIPDLPGDPNLSGDLSHKYPLPKNASYIGILSRFSKNCQLPTSPGLPFPSSPLPLFPSPDLLVLLSGPEPQRSIFEKIVMEELDRHRGLHAVVLQGLPGEHRESFPIPGVAVFNHLPDTEIEKLIRNAGIIVCRPGYSTLMDLVALGRNAILVPTPGQTEQEYLAERLSGSGQFFAMEQDRFDLGLALEEGLRLKEPTGFQ
jgi:predicted glycosyltransferase